MGTRGVFGFRLSGKEYVVYNHYDSYPDGLGVEVIKFIRSVNVENGWSKLRDLVSALSLVNPESKPDVATLARYDGLFSSMANNIHARTWSSIFSFISPLFILQAVYTGTLIHFPDDALFLKSWSCEYAYIIDIDAMMLDFRCSKRTIGFPLVFVMVGDLYDACVT